MTLFSTLRSRIFITSALLAVLSIGVAVFVVNRSVSREAELELQQTIRETGTIVENLRARQAETFTVTARLIADLPKLVAAVETNDPPTVQDIAAEYRSQLRIEIMVVTNASGRVLAAFGAAPATAEQLSRQPAIRDALAGGATFSLLEEPNGLLQVAAAPVAITATGRAPEIIGTLSVGSFLNDAVARQLKEATGSDLAFGLNQRVLASTLPAEARPALARLLGTAGISHVRLGEEDYLVLPQRLATSAPHPAEPAPFALILRSRTGQLRYLRKIHTALGVTALLAVAVATILSFAVARTITSPLAALTDVMRDVATTGDLTRKIVIKDRGWADADARLLAATFNTLTDSIARFQRAMSQKERLSSLGRMSTVVAHEIRNPLMIIKAALHPLRKPGVSAEALREAIADIDEEVVRLNRIVNEVLDFARPIPFELAVTDLNALCRESAAAAEAGGPGAPIALELDPAAPPVTVDPERLRQALVNMLVNARHAVEAAGSQARAATSPSAAPASGRGGDPEAASRRSAPPILLKTQAIRSRVSILIADRGAGIDPADLPRVFDPFFTTKRGGSGLGLAISKNIVEGLGGTIAVASTPGDGTEIRIELPADLPHRNVAARAARPANS